MHSGKAKVCPLICQQLMSTHYTQAGSERCYQLWQRPGGSVRVGRAETGHHLVAMYNLYYVCPVQISSNAPIHLKI